MEVIINTNAEESCKLAARLIEKVVREKPNCVLGLATGMTPLPLYRELVRLHRDEGLDFCGVRTFNLDEYVGLSPDHPGSYRRFMQEHLFKHINIEPKNTHIPDGNSDNIRRTCDEYEKAIEGAGGIDLQVLGIGTEGHIGFNEPISSLSSRTRIKTLAEKTVQMNAVHFESVEAVPRHVITMGIGTIMDARVVMLLGHGASKARVLAKAIEGPVTAMVPASVLQHHESAKMFLDEEAAAELKLAGYYKQVFSRKPEWQRF